jgi:hypothetical protein
LGGQFFHKFVLLRFFFFGFFFFGFPSFLDFPSFLLLLYVFLLLATFADFLFAATAGALAIGLFELLVLFVCCLLGFPFVAAGFF